MPSKTAEVQGVDGGGVTRFYPLYYVQRKHDRRDSCVHCLRSAWGARRSQLGQQQVGDDDRAACKCWCALASKPSVCTVSTLKQFAY